MVHVIIVVKSEPDRGKFIIYTVFIGSKILHCHIADKHGEDQTYDGSKYLANICTILFALQSCCLVEQSLDLMGLLFGPSLRELIAPWRNFLLLYLKLKLRHSVVGFWSESYSNYNFIQFVYKKWAFFIVNCKQKQILYLRNLKYKYTDYIILMQK